MLPVPEPRIRAFEELGFGMFVHWGLYSQLGKGEWIQNAGNIPAVDYERLMDSFTASRFDGQALARMARHAGARYITLTTRHHEGFSLYDTRGLSTFDAPHSPAGRDLVREFVEGCRAEGIIPFFYHTTLDWHDPRFHDDFKSYLRYLRESVEILCTEYGRIGGLWFDGNWSRPNDDWEEDALYRMIRRHQPDAVIVNNTGLSERGVIGHPELDSVTFEQGRPDPMDRRGMKKYVAAEMCQTLNMHWGYGAQDLNYKSLACLIETLCACRRAGANYLLNIGPDGEGGILPLQAALMTGIGDWIRATGDAVYYGRPCGVRGAGRDFALRRGDTLYFFVHDLSVTGDANVVPEGGGAGERTFTGMPGRVESVCWTDNGEPLAFRSEADTCTFSATGYPYGTNLVVRIAEARLQHA